MKALAGITIISAVLLAGCESGDIKMAKETVASELRDPDSAQFRNIIESKENEWGVVTVCGEVNGKNAYGGYVGYQRFVNSPPSNRVYMEKSWLTFDDLWDSSCIDS